MANSSMPQTDSIFSGRNGFKDPIIVAMSEPELAGGKVKSSQDLREAAFQRRKAEQLLEINGAYGPSLAAMREELDAPETSSGVTELLDELNRRHFEDTQKLFDQQVKDYLEEAVDAYLTKDDGMEIPDIDHFYDSLVSMSAANNRELASAFSEHKYAYLRTFTQLLHKRAGLAVAEDEARRKRDAQFPTSQTEYRALRDKDVKERVARFLTADKYSKDRMMSEFGWVYRQVKPLEDDFARETIFRTEIQHAVRNMDSTRDPRRK